jgi:polysaccharide export outer membrane protein
MFAVTGTPTIAHAQSNINAPLPEQPAQSTREIQPYSDYILGPGDEVSITVFGYEEYSLNRVIEPNGTIVLPVIGSVEIGGKTSAMAAQDLANQLNYYLVNPVVTVTTTALRPVFVTVSGEVQRPGPIQLEGPNTRNNDDLPGLPTLSTALVEAGGVTSHADIRDVRLKRTLPNGEEDVITINLWDNLWSEAVAENPLLQDGDTIYVPRLVAGNEIDPRLVARSSLAPETVRVRVVGEVTRPGEVAVPPNSSLSSAVAIAGGPTDDAQLGRALFVRLSAEGTIERQEVNLENLTDTYQVQDGDVVIVPKRNTSSILDFAARLLNPLGSLFDIFDNDIFDDDNNN